jgi:ferritin-like protein
MDRHVAGQIAVKINSGDPVASFTLNVYRYNENNRALRLSKFAELVRDPELKLLVAKHFADEARHALVFTKRVLELGGDVYPLPAEIDYLYKLEANGIGISLERMLEPRDLTDDEIVQFLVADEFLEARGVKTLSEHLATEADPRTRAVVDAILRDEKGHVSYISESLAALRDPKMKERATQLHEQYRIAEESVHEEQAQALQKHLDALQSKVQLASSAQGFGALAAKASSAETRP